MVCKNCGYQLSNEEKICTKCGHNLQKRNSKSKYILIIIMAIVLIAGVITFFLFNPKFKKDVNTTKENITISGNIDEILKSGSLKYLGKDKNYVLSNFSDYTEYGDYEGAYFYQVENDAYGFNYSTDKCVAVFCEFSEAFPDIFEISNSEIIAKEEFEVFLGKKSKIVREAEERPVPFLLVYEDDFSIIAACDDDGNIYKDYWCEVVSNVYARENGNKEENYEEKIKFDATENSPENQSDKTEAQSVVPNYKPLTIINASIGESYNPKAGFGSNNDGESVDWIFRIELSNYNDLENIICSWEENISCINGLTYVGNEYDDFGWASAKSGNTHWHTYVNYESKHILEIVLPDKQDIEGPQHIILNDKKISFELIWRDGYSDGYGWGITDVIIE